MVFKLSNCISCCVNAIVIGGLFIVLTLLICISCCVTVIVIGGLLFLVIKFKLHQLLCDCYCDQRFFLYGAEFKLLTVQMFDIRSGLRCNHFVCREGGIQLDNSQMQGLYTCRQGGIQLDNSQMQGLYTRLRKWCKIQTDFCR